MSSIFGVRTRRPNIGGWLRAILESRLRQNQQNMGGRLYRYMNAVPIGTQPWHQTILGIGGPQYPAQLELDKINPLFRRT